MLNNLKKELISFMKDVKENIKDEEDLFYITKRIDKLVDRVIKETEKIVNYKENEVNEILKQQEKESQKLEELKNKVDNLYADIYEEDYEEGFQITCPYCGTNFDALIDEDFEEIVCPECSNHIELDWSGNPNDDEPNSGCSGSCSKCGGRDK